MTHARHRARDAGDLPARHRRRLLAPLLNGKIVLELDAAVGNPHRPISGDGVPPPDVVLQLAAMETEAAEHHARAMLSMLAPDGIAVITCREPMQAAALRRLAPHHAHYTQRIVQGSLLRLAEFESSRIAVLRDPAPVGTVHIYVLAHQRPPPLDTGLLEAGVQTTSATVPDVPPATPLDAPPPIIAGAQPDLPDDNAVSLARRLLRQEEDLLHFYRHAKRLEAAQADLPAGRGAHWFEPPAMRHDWKLARLPRDTGLGDDPYDRRVDDPAILEARAGEAFFANHALGLPGADAARAAAALMARQNNLAPLDGAAPDVSIIIPVYGQIAYTLNCLDSLLRHTTRYTAEIIIIDDCSPDETGVVLPGLPQIRYHRQPRNGGFINSCNTGGALARGQYVVMLNNDTRVVDGWLDALIGSFVQFPRAGLVGSKMLYADGSLQEAGGIIWRDGSAWNYGRNDDPNRPHYAYARQVDYVSGCSIALRRADWDTLGGFDAHYHPAYCEDADLCLRVAASGAEIWFQPQSRVIHYEGKTSGTDTSSGVKSYQVLNTKKLFLRWRDRLVAHRPNGEAPYFEKDRSARKRMLVIDASAPTPDQDAGSLQTVLGLQSCRALGYAASFVPEDNFLFQPGYTTDLQAAGVECVYAPYEFGMEAYLRRHGRLFDVIMVYRVTVLAKIARLIRAHAPQAALLYHVADLHFLRMERQAALEQDPGLLAQAAGMREQELKLAQTADCTITHSQFEAGLLAELVPDAAVCTWPLMYPVHGTERGFADRRDVVFLGGYRHSPNIDAVLHFCQDIMPGLRSAEPGLRFIAAGANPTEEVISQAAIDVEVTGQVADLRTVLDRARVFVCPLRAGAGVKGKIMTALAYGIPVVSTTIGIEGSGLEPGRHVLLADDAESFMRQTLRLYRDPDLWQRLSQAGLQLMADEFSPECGATFLGAAIDLAWAKKLGVAAA
jgi:O-antigen biosynthesis protein